MNAFVAGGAGFIGSHTVRRLLRDRQVQKVTVYDNFSSGTRDRLPNDAGSRLKVVAADLSDLDAVCDAMAGSDEVFHYASNPDIARAATDPTIDFWQGTYLTNNIVEAMRRTGVPRIVYASGSGVYGEAGNSLLNEDYSPMLPISTYGASKLAGESLICSYCHMFGLQGRIFRFANVVGPGQTHGVGYDFLRRLHDDPTRLRVLGDGTQSKSYIHVEDILDGIWTARYADSAPYSYFNISTDDRITVTQIAQVVFEVMGIRDVRMEYTGGDRGWKGDVPQVRIDATKLKMSGWNAKRSSREAIEASVRDMHEEILRRKDRPETVVENGRGGL